MSSNALLLSLFALFAPLKNYLLSFPTLNYGFGNRFWNAVPIGYLLQNDQMKYCFFQNHLPMLVLQTRCLEEETIILLAPQSRRHEGYQPERSWEGVFQTFCFSPERISPLCPESTEECCSTAVSLRWLHSSFSVAK